MTARQRGNDIGPTGETVGKNLRRIRRSLGLTYDDVADRLAAARRPIPAAMIGRIESGYRKVEVDDLMSLAVALDVSPLALMLPDTRRQWEAAQVTGVTTSAGRVWEWAMGKRSLLSDISPREFESRSLPAWLQVTVDMPEAPEADLQFPPDSGLQFVAQEGALPDGEHSQAAER